MPEDMLEELRVQIEALEPVAQQHWQDDGVSQDPIYHRDEHGKVFLRVAIELVEHHWEAGWRVSVRGPDASHWAIKAYPGRTPIAAAQSLLALMHHWSQAISRESPR